MFVKKALLDVSEDGQVESSSLLGNVLDIKTQASKNMPEAQEWHIPGMFLYTITNAGLAKGSAGVLTDSVRRSLKGDTLVSTISPVLAFRGKYSAEELAIMTDDNIRTEVIRHLKENRDLAYDLHCKRNGSATMNIHINRDDPDGDLVTINYLYTSSKMEQTLNSDNAVAGAPTISHELKNLYESAARAYVFQVNMIAVNRVYILQKSGPIRQLRPAVIFFLVVVR